LHGRSGLRVKGKTIFLGLTLAWDWELQLV
jgi:hypothetical protein